MITQPRSPRPDRTAGGVLTPHRLLTPAEERSLARAAQRGSRAAADSLVTSNLRLVAHIARRYCGRGVAFDDLVQAGAVGLLTAQARYDWRRARFSTHAVPWIRKEILAVLRIGPRPVRIPGDRLDDIIRMRRVHARLAAALDRPPTAAEVADECGLTLAAVEAMRQDAMVADSLDRPVAASTSTLGERLAAPCALPGDALLAAEERTSLAACLDGLDARARRLLQLRHGLAGAPPLSAPRVAARLGMGPRGVAALERRALTHVRQRAEAAGLGGESPLG